LPGSNGAVLSPAVLLVGPDVADSPPERLVFAQRAGGPLALDYYSASEANAPLLVVIHGGGWRAGAADDLASLNYWLAARGVAVAAIRYRFAPAHPFPAAVDDVRAAIDWLKARSDDLGFDGGRIALLGRSAGGHLALLAAYSAADPAVRGVISFYGPTDLVWSWEHPSPEPVYDSRGTLAGFTGGTPIDRPDVYAAASPLSFVAGAIPTLLVHGVRDPLVSVEHSRMLTDSLRSRGSPVTFIEMPWATHGCDFAFNGPCGQISATAVARFLEDVLGE
jgi:acetyl esterase/lipase